MSLVNILNIQVVGENPTAFSNAFQFEITFECNAELKNDLEWRMIYASAEEENMLDSITVGPIPIGTNKFIFEADAPKPENFKKKEDMLECQVLLLTCLYNDNEFVRIGYYVNNEYIDEELRENPPNEIRVDRLQRNILADKPKVTRYTINWDTSKEAGQPAVDQQVSQTDDPMVDMMVQ